ncbi:MAG: tetratricopeptide repeat protein, partial [Acidobacteria bacterium]
MSEDYKRPSQWLARSPARPKGWRSGLTIVSLVGLLLASDPFGCRLLPIYHQARFGQRHRQVLHQTNPIRRNAPYGREQYWALDARAGQAVTITAQSYEFDPYLILISPTGQEIAWSDDSGGFFNARISTTLPVSGRYTIVICGLNADQYGTYWLSVEEEDQPTVWDETAASAYYDRGMAWAEREQNRRAMSWLDLAMGRYFRQHRQWKRAEAYYARSLAAAQRAGFTYGQWAVALERGILLRERRRYDRAIDQLERALEMSRGLRAADWAEAVTAIQLGDLYRYIGRAELAATYYRKATDHLRS